MVRHTMSLSPKRAYMQRLKSKSEQSKVHDRASGIDQLALLCQFGKSSMSWLVSLPRELCPRRGVGGYDVAYRRRTRPLYHIA